MCLLLNFKKGGFEMQLSNRKSYIKYSNMKDHDSKIKVFRKKKKLKRIKRVILQCFKSLLALRISNCEVIPYSFL